MNLTESDKFHIRAAEGWVGLGDYLEANAELENVSPGARTHPSVLKLRFVIYSKEGKWDACKEIARAITTQLPNHAIGWLHYAYATRRATGGSVEAAYEILSSVAEKFPDHPTVAYNLACYECQLGNLPEAWKWLERAFEVAKDAGALKMKALDEKDLEQLWTDIVKIQAC